MPHASPQHKVFLRGALWLLLFAMLALLPQLPVPAARMSVLVAGGF